MNASRRPRSQASGPAGHGRGPLGRSVRVVLQGFTPGERPKGAALPVLAVVGRSNVGKSSLLNALLGVKAAKVSQTPGRTQGLFWYRVDERFDVVDCPGYGFAKRSRDARAGFATLIERLLADEPRPALGLLLVDSRLEPQDLDLSMAFFLRDARVPTLVAATKWDAVKPASRVKSLRALERAYRDDLRSLQPVSAETGENLHLLSERILAALAARPAAPTADSAKESPHAST